MTGLIKGVQVDREELGLKWVWRCCGTSSYSSKQLVLAVLHSTVPSQRNPDVRRILIGLIDRLSVVCREKRTCYINN